MDTTIAMDTDFRRLRGMLAERRITHTEFARASGLNRAYLCRILCGAPAGELARIKMQRGLAALGLDKEAEYAVAS